MYEFLVRNTDGRLFVYRTDEQPEHPYDKEVRCFTVCRPDAYSDIVNINGQQKIVSWCSDRCLQDKKLSTPDDAYAALMEYWNVPEEQGGFRRVDYLDVTHAHIYRGWYSYQHNLADHINLMSASEVLAIGHPLADRLEWLGINIHYAVLYLSFLMDPRRFVNPNDLQDSSFYEQYTSINEGVSAEVIEAAVHDGEYVPATAEELVWVTLFQCWYPQDGIPKRFPASPENYWFRRFWDHMKDYHKVVKHDEAEHYAITHVTREVGDYILSLWQDYLEIKRFDHESFWKYPGLAKLYSSEFIYE